MKKLFSDSVVSWLTTLLFGIWGIMLFCSAVDAQPEAWILLPALAVWTLAAALLDTAFGYAAVTVVLVLAEAVSFSVLGGDVTISSVTALLTGGTVDHPAVLHTVLLMGAAAFTAAAQYLFKSFTARAVWCAAWIAAWIAAAFAEYELSKIPLAAGAALVLMTLSEGLRRRNDRGEGYPDLQRSVTVFLACVGAVLLMLPVSSEPYPYPILNAIVEKLENAYEDMVTELLFREDGDSEFSMSLAGYSEDGAVGEGYRSDGSLSGLLAKSRLTTDGSLYLAGNSWDTFDGQQWTAQAADDPEGLLDWNLDAAERIYSLWRYQKRGETAGTTAYLRASSVYIRYEGLSTRTLFTAPVTVNIATDRERFPWDERPGRVLFDYLQTRDTYYRIHYLEQNEARLGEWASFSEGYVYDEQSDLTWLSIFGDYRAEFGLTLAVFDTDERIESVLARRQTKIRETYLQLPEGLSDRVRQLAEEITGDAGNDYEKLLAIGEYLRSHYTYTTSPPAVPEETAFLDYVLFGSESGYCTWYATAAAILARCVGIPARYVQGYCTELEAGILTEVDESRSHAWCEGYIPGLGWVTLEATPGFLRTGDGWESFPDRDTDPLPEDESEETVAEEPELSAESSGFRGKGVLWVCMAALAAAGSIAAFRMLRKYRGYRRLSWSGKTEADLVRFLSAGVRRDFRRRKEESIRQYFGRLRWMLRLDAERTEAMTVLYEEILFAGREATEAEWRENREFLRKVHAMRRRHRAE